MRILLDANILIAALLGSRGKLTILTSHNHQFYAPIKIIEEIKKYKVEICSKGGFSSEEFDENFDSLMFFITIVDYVKYQGYMEKAINAIVDRDAKDADYIACALFVNADFIWTDDNDLFDQNLIDVKTTDQFIEENK